MSRRMEEGERHIPHIDPLTIIDIGVNKPDRCRLVEDHRGSGRGGQSMGAGEVVSLDVGLKDVRNSHGLLGGRLEIRFDVELWIHHSAASCTRSAEQVAGAAGFRRQKVAKNHGRPPYMFWPCHTPGGAIGS